MANVRSSVFVYLSDNTCAKELFITNHIITEPKSVLLTLSKHIYKRNVQACQRIAFTSACRVLIIFSCLQPHQNVFFYVMLPPPSWFQSDWRVVMKKMVVSGHYGFLQQLNCRLLLLNFSGWRDARRENSRKTSAQEMSSATGDTKVKRRCAPLQGTMETAESNLLVAFKHQWVTEQDLLARSWQLLQSPRTPHFNIQGERADKSLHERSKPQSVERVKLHSLVWWYKDIYLIRILQVNYSYFMHIFWKTILVDG